MSRRTGRLLAGVAMLGAMTAAERVKGRYMRAPDGHGGAADHLEDPPTPDGTPTPSPTPTPDGTPTPSPTPAATDEQLAWAGAVSKEGGEGDTASNFDWLKSKGFKDLDGLVKSTRDTEKALREKGGIKVPGEDAKPEEIAAYRTAIGVPDKPEGYEVELPAIGEGEDKLELDVDFVNPMRELAHKNNVSAGAFKAFASGFVQHQLDAMANAVKAQDAEVNALFKDWGPNKAAKLQDFRQGAKLLGLDRAGLASWQASAGSRVVMEKLADLGSKVSEDLLAGGDGNARYGVASEEDAQKQIDGMIGDADTAAKLKAKDPATTAKWNRLNEAVASFRERAAKK